MISFLKTLRRWLRNLIIFFFTSTILSVVILKYIPVYITPLMLIRAVEQMADGEFPAINHRWVPLDQINHNMAQAVMAAEDNFFLQHNGFDLGAIHMAQVEAKKGKPQRGASSISQQTARNVFLTQHRSWLRKGLEAYFTILIEYIWGKERIMEVYLNSIEMGKGIYGVDAVSRINFGTTPDRITREQSALVAVSLPNPLQRDSAHPNSMMKKKQRTIVRRMREIDQFPRDVCAK